MDISSLQRKVDAANVPFEQLASNSHIPENEKMAEVCRQFESVLLLQILRDARKPVVESDKNLDASSVDIYADMINHQLADNISRSGSFGLAASLESQFTRQVSSSSQASAPEPKNPI